MVNSPQMAVSEKVERIAVYTAVSGGYDKLKAPEVIAPDCDYFVFSDFPVVSEVWQWRPLPYADADPTRSARFIKLHPHLLFEDYELSIWLDANLQILGDIVEFRQDLPAQDCVATWQHPHRACVYEEVETCLELLKDNPDFIKPQIDRYRAEGFPAGRGLFETSVLVRRHHDPRCIKLMRHWWGEILAGSRRDQLSLTYAAWKSDVEVQSFADKEVNMRNDPRLRHSRHAGSPEKPSNNTVESFIQ